MNRSVVSVSLSIYHSAFLFERLVGFFVVVFFFLGGGGVRLENRHTHSLCQTDSI